MLLRRMLIMLAAVIAVVAILAGYKVYSIRQQIALFSAPKPPISVTASLAEKRPWQSRLPAIGSLKAFQGVTLTAEVSGTVRDVLFLSGDQVKLDQPLIQLESDVEEATLRTAEADLGLARAEYQRGRELIGSKAISKSEFDRLAAQWAKTSATVAELKAALAKKRVLAPFAGTIGIRQVDVGDYVSPGTPIATLQDLSTLLLDFHLPEQDFPLLSRGQLMKVRVAAYPGQVFDAEIAAINPKVDNETRNLQVRAALENPDGKLLPGMFANLEVMLPGEEQRVVVPETAITFTLYGDSIYVVGQQKDEQGQASKDDKGQPQRVVERRFVRIGERREGLAVVLEGLEGGEQVVTSGQLKLDNGASVAIVAERDLQQEH
ncbi:multidrug efflux RND transporter periplasmic adaptor subunit MexV [Pseudomonas aeruginosa]|uniref:multidrug efflux RND transporter periplasmic adaptor subunit MexV n=1 Tax=Pseudomonas aeruginosa TaxID=287 RepID=UPI000F52B1CC|nr:multidrug efflux RND transporter periplasmic adaptor subunit MexV [Pseudomonas aeruginosa]RPX44511.1 efflux transporter periplasmic adaptor subunit [Pseudomonas aeruginosa]WCV83852.1 multidrug efflux RND transporter periplasmic adaptor subunit MexV [Pseudomonas aeruginosa]